MIWPLLANIIWNSSIGGTKIIREVNTLYPEITNVIVISIIVMSIRGLMKMKRINKKEEESIIVVVIVRIIVSTSFIADSPILFLILIEITVIPLRFIIINSSKDKDKVESVKFIVILNTVGSIPFMSVCFWQDFILRREYPARRVEVRAAIILTIVLFLVKTPIFLTHIWLTKVHVAASGNCSIILARIIIKLGTIGIFKFYKWFEKDRTTYLLISVSMIGALYMTIIIWRYFDNKTLIAMSSVLHIAILVPIIIIKKRLTIIASIMMITSHGIISYYLFYLITINYEMVENRSSLTIKSTERRRKQYFMLVTIFAFLNIGIPLFINFFSECVFIVTFNRIHSLFAQAIIASIILATIIFTIQIVTRNLYGEKKVCTKKNIPSTIIVKSIYFMIWSFLIILTM